MRDPAHTAQAQAFAGRLFSASLAAGELMTVYLGLKLGLYRALTDGPADAGELAGRAGIAARYAREWLEQQAAAGVLEVEAETDVAGDPDRRRFRLPRGHAEALLVPDGPFAVAPFTMLPVGGIGPMLPDLLDAYRSGTGVSYERYGADFRGGQAGLNEGVFRRQLPGWIRRRLPDVHARLSAGDAVLVDVACGGGASSLSLARAYPGLRVHGYDRDEQSVLEAREAAGREGLADRVAFHARDAAGELGDRADVVTLFDALHDMADPVGVLTACRGLLGPGATMLLMEPRVGERFDGAADDTERFFHVVSVLHCLPVGLADTPSAGTGTMIRPSIVARYAVDAGFREVVDVDVAHRFHRLYRLNT